MTEDRCLAEEKASYLTPFLPLSTNLPRKSGLRPDRHLDGQPAQPNSQLAYGSRVHLNHHYAPINHKGFSVSRTGKPSKPDQIVLGQGTGSRIADVGPESMEPCPLPDLLRKTMRRSWQNCSRSTATSWPPGSRSGTKATTPSRASASPLGPRSSASARELPSRTSSSTRKTASSAASRLTTSCGVRSCRATSATG